MDEAELFSVFVGDLAPDVNDFLLMETFRAWYPTVRSAKVITDPSTGRSKGYGFVRFSSELERDRALEMQGFNLSGRPIRVSLATARRNAGAGAAPPPRAAPHPAELDPANTTLFIGGLSGGVCEDHLRAAFAPYGELVYVKVPAGKGCGFVQYVDRGGAEMAMASLNGQIIGANAIRISWGRSTSRAPAACDAAAAALRGGGGGGGGGGAYGALLGGGGGGGLPAMGGYAPVMVGAGGVELPPGYGLVPGYGGMMPGFAPNQGGYALQHQMLQAPPGACAAPPAGAAQAAHHAQLAAMGLVPAAGAQFVGGYAMQPPPGAPPGGAAAPGAQQGGFDPAGGPDVAAMNAAFAARQQQLLGGGAFMLPRPQ